MKFETLNQYVQMYTNSNQSENASANKSYHEIINKVRQHPNFSGVENKIVKPMFSLMPFVASPSAFTKCCFKGFLESSSEFEKYVDFSRLENSLEFEKYVDFSRKIENMFLDNLATNLSVAENNIYNIITFFNKEIVDRLILIGFYDKNKDIISRIQQSISLKCMSREDFMWMKSFNFCQNVLGLSEKDYKEYVKNARDSTNTTLRDYIDMYTKNPDNERA